MHTDTKPNLHKKQQLLLQKIPKDSWYILSIHHVSQNFDTKAIEQSYQQTYQKLDQYFKQSVPKEHSQYESIQDLKQVWSQVDLPSSLAAWRTLGITQMPLTFVYSIEYMPSILIELPKSNKLNQQQHLY